MEGGAGCTAEVSLTIVEVIMIAVFHWSYARLVSAIEPFQPGTIRLNYGTWVVPERLL